MPAGAEVKLTQEPDWNATANEFVAMFRISTTAAANAGKRVLLPALVFQLNEKPMFPNAQRTNGVYLYYPSREIDQVTIVLPANLDIENVPQNEHFKLTYAVYTSEWTPNPKDKTVTVVRDLANADYIFPLTEYTALKDFYDKVKSSDEQQAILRMSANAVGK